MAPDYTSTGVYPQLGMSFEGRLSLAIIRSVELAHFPDYERGVLKSPVDESILTLLRKIRQEIRCIHIAHVGDLDCCMGSDIGSNEVFMLATYPMDWMAHYFVKNYTEADPIMQGMTLFPKYGLDGAVCNLTQDALLDDAGRDFLNDAESRGLGDLHIAVCSVNPFGFRGITVFTFDTDKDIENVILDHSQLVCASSRIHNAIFSRRDEGAFSQILTKREAECLFWAAQGKTDGEISQILKVKRWTVISYIQNAKRKLGCYNRTSAVVSAVVLGLIRIPEGVYIKPLLFGERFASRLT